MHTQYLKLLLIARIVLEFYNDSVLNVKPEGLPQYTYKESHVHAYMYMFHYCVIYRHLCNITDTSIISRNYFIL
jgi:hypothetical protein